MTNTSYRVVTKSGTFHAPFNTGNPNNWTRGETASFTFEIPNFSTKDTLTVSNSHTVQGVETYKSVTVESGATLTIPEGQILHTKTVDSAGTVDNSGELITYNKLTTIINQFVDFAGKYTTNEMLNGKVKYRSQIPSSASISTLAWGIEPNQSLRDDNIVGVWGLVDSIQNQRNRMPTINRYQVDVLVLAEYSEYADHTALENDLQI